MKLSVYEDGQKILSSSSTARKTGSTGELPERFEDFFKEIDKGTARGNFTFAETEENE